MADKYVYSHDIMGQPVRAPADAADDISLLGNQFIGKDQAIAEADAQRNLSYVDQNWGALGKAGMGALSGLTLGLGPGLLASGGLVDPKHLEAAQVSPYYMAGDIAGTVAPAILSGGESLLGRGLAMTPAGLMGAAGGVAERAIGKVLPEAVGLLGAGASVPVRLAARGATEGALISLGHQVGENLVQNKPLAAEAMAAMGDGALFGGLIGGGFGTLGYLGSKAVEGASKAARRVATGGSELGAVRRVASELGGGVESEILDVANKDVAAGKGLVRQYAEVLEGGGAKIGDSTVKKYQAAQTYTKAQEAVRANAVEALDSSASPFVPSFNRIEGRLETEIASQYNQSVNRGDVLKELTSIRKDFENVWPHADIPGNTVEPVPAKTAKPVGASAVKSVEVEPARPGYEIPDMRVATGENPSWKVLIQARDDFAAKATTPIKRQALSILDSEIEAAMKGAGETLGQKVADAAKEYAASTTGIKLSKALEESLGATVNRVTGAPITMRDVGTAGGMALGLGKPASAATWLSAKGIGKMMHDKVGPWLAQMAYDNSIAAKAAESTNAVKGRITKSLDKFFAKPKTGKAVSAAYAASKQRSSGPDRATYEAEANRVQRLISDNHMSRVQRYADDIARQGYQDLANQLMAVNQRAVLYVMNAMPKRKGAKALTSLRPQPVPMTLDMDEHRFLRQLSGMDFNQLMDDFDSGKLSRDQVRTAWNVMPEIRNELAQQASMRIAEMKANGESLPMDKVMNLSLLLDAPLDRVAEADFINPVQQALNTPASPPPGPQGPPPANMAASIDATGMLTPLQQNLMG